GDYSDDEIHQRVEDIIKRMMLTSLRNNLIKNLSGGQKKRVEVAIQAIGDQEIFILDEPDSGMDFASRVDLMENLKSCTESGGVVSVISHSPDDAAEMFTKVIVLAKSQSDEVGHLAFYGDVPNALKFFGVNKLSEIVMEINYEGGKGRADEFINKFEATRRG
ncbi:MAG: ATP-binding cassette domain-containing protein, partial [Ruminococcus sp.]|nr:ATP-binding cassette domain-containing protein [Ruminococcus sp.]